MITLTIDTIELLGPVARQIDESEQRVKRVQEEIREGKEKLFFKNAVHVCRRVEASFRRRPK